MKPVRLTEKEVSRYLTFCLTSTLNRLLLEIFKFLLDKKYDVETTIATYMPSTIMVHNYLPITDLVRYRGENVFASSFGQARTRRTKDKQLSFVSLYQFNCLSLADIELTLMHELTHVHQQRTKPVKQNKIVSAFKNSYDDYKNSDREKEAECMALEFRQWCRDKNFTVSNFKATKLLLSVFPQGKFLFGVKKTGVTMIGFKSRDLSNFKDIL